MTQRALVVLLTPLEAAAIEEGLLPVIHRLTSHHQVVLASVADPAVHAMATGRGDAYAVYGAAAAERAGLDRAGITAELMRSGVDVVDAGPEDLPPRLADRYLVAGQDEFNHAQLLKAILATKRMEEFATGAARVPFPLA